MSFLFEFIPAAVSVILGLIIAVTLVVVSMVWIFDRPECNDKGRLMNLQTSWSLSTGCMVNLRGQWLPWREVSPVERDGKIIFAPKPTGVVKVEK